MVAEQDIKRQYDVEGCSLAKISMVAELIRNTMKKDICCSLAKISMVAERIKISNVQQRCCSLAKISMVAELFRRIYTS